MFPCALPSVPRSPRYRRSISSRRLATGHNGPMTDSGPNDHRPAMESDAVGPTGQFRIYMGAVAGVGKTFAMLDEGWRRHHRGADVVVGFVETHGRPRTAELIRDLEVVPRKVVDYRGSQFEEMDRRCRPRPEAGTGPRGRARPHQRPGIGALRQAMAGRHGAHRRRDRRHHHRERAAPREHRRCGGAHDRDPGARAGTRLGRAQG